MEQLIPRETLDMLSFHSALGQSLKQISLRATPLETILDDIAKYRSSYIDVLVQENLIGSRFKSEDSIIRKYEKTLQTSGGFKQCFNDVLGFRLRFEEYPDAFPDYLRVVDLRRSKKIDGKLTTVTAQFISITSGTIWLIRLRFSSGVGRTSFSIYGAIGTFTSTKLRKWGKRCTGNTPAA